MKRSLFILLLAALGVKAQQSPLTGAAAAQLQTIASALDSFRTKLPVEKVHLQMDKPFYVLGDTLWMKAYVADEENRLSPLSNLLNVDLVDDHGVVKASLRLPLTDGMGWGDIALTDSLFSGGNYHIRAYTALMRNYGDAYFFDKDIRIGNTLDLDNTLASTFSPSWAASAAGMAAIKPAADTAVSVQFFPEGGDLVDGLPSVVAFKALGPDGLGRNISGYIADKENKHVADFRTEHAGMGAFVLLPQADNAYTAVIKFADSNRRRFVLPKALPQGYVLSVSQNADKVFVRVLASSSLLKTGPVTLIAQAGNTIRYSGVKEPNGRDMIAVVPKSGLPEGIMQFTLFSPTFQPVAERLVFIRKGDDKLTIKVTPDKPGYQPRDKVHLNLAVTDNRGNPVTGAFSLAVTDQGKVPYSETGEKTIFSDLLLSGDLKGYIEHPNYYFMDTSTVKARELDNLLLTQGWRRFVWKDIINNTPSALAYTANAGMGISGQVLTGKGAPAANAKVYILLNTAGGRVIDTVADAQGKFRFDRIALPKGLTYIVSATDAKGKKKVTVSVDKPNETPPAWHKLPDDGQERESFITYIDSARKQNIAVRNSTPEYKANADMTTKAIALKEVEIREKRADEIKKIALKNSKSIAGPADKVLTFVDMQHCNSLGGCLVVGKLGNIMIIPKSDGGFNGAFEGGPIAIVLNGKLLSPQEAKIVLPTITPDQIAAIEVIEGARAGIYKYGSINLDPKYDRLEPPTADIIITLKSGEDYQKYIDQYQDDKTEAMAKEEVAKQETKNTPVIRKAALAGSKNLAGPGQANTVLTFADLADCSGDLKGCLVDHLPGIKLKDRPLGGWEALFKGTAMKVYVDGLETGASSYSIITPATIAAVEAVDSGGPEALYHGPALLISLKKTDVDYDAYLLQHNKDRSNAIQLKEIEIKARKLGVSIQDMAVKHSQNLAGAGHADQVLTFVDLLGCQSNLSQCLQGRMTNVTFKLDANGNLAPFSRGFDSPMLIVVNGVPGRSLDDVISSDVASVEVLRGGGAAALYGLKGANGVLIITTKQGDVDYDAFTGNFHSVSEKPRVIKTYTFNGGYDLRREFYSPDYDNPATNKQLADLRTTIYWAPDIITDKDGKASVSFFNSDDKGSYRVITEGLDGQGKLGRQVDRYTVK